ncbi:MAG TPA: hypothetical protein VFO35_04475 [Steroidobacteraceae bacterium]|nr:hypothetical protein [Steroidobacteraceae bacterium]
MATSVVVITLLTIVASLASWLFSQWLARRARISALALAAGGVGSTLLIGAVALVMVTTTTSWRQLIPIADTSPLVAPEPPPERSAWPATVEAQSAATPTSTPRPDDPAAAAERLRMSVRKPEMLASAESHLERNEYSRAIEIAREYLAVHRSDAEMRSLLARALFAAQHPGPASIIPAAVVAQWPATDCVESMRAEESAHWILDNGCDRVVAVLFASCELSETACFANALVSQGGWKYEPNGILLTAGNDKPLPLRLGDGGPRVAPIFTIRDAGGVRRQIRYLACEVTAPGVLRALREYGGEPAQQALTAELSTDACYLQVLDWTRSGRRTGASPDALLRRGVN